MTWNRSEVEAMHKEFLTGKTYRELGEEYGLSHERVRQLFREHHLPIGRALRQVHQRKVYEAEAAKRVDEIHAAYRKHGNVKDAAKEVNLPAKHVAPYVRAMDDRLLYQNRKATPQQHTDEEILECIRKAAEVAGEPLTLIAYKRLAPEMGLVAHLTIHRRFGSWQKACRKAGVTYTRASGQHRQHITQAQCVEALRACREDLGRIPSYNDYMMWASVHGGPSGPTVRMRCDGWRNAQRLSFEESA